MLTIGGGLGVENCHERHMGRPINLRKHRARKMTIKYSNPVSMPNKDCTLYIKTTHAAHDEWSGCHGRMKFCSSEFPPSRPGALSEGTGRMGFRQRSPRKERTTINIATPSQSGTYTSKHS